MKCFVGLNCAMCDAPFPAEAFYVCDKCLGPLQATYDMNAIKATVTRELIASRPQNIWRYREFLPIVGEPRTGFHSGFTPLIRANRLADELGLRELYLKDDSINRPTLSYKDRVVPIAATRAIELGISVFACASTGNLSNSVAVHAASLGLECYVFFPCTIEPAKVQASTIAGAHAISVDGTYDDVNRLCTQVNDRYNWGFANINLRPYYAEGAKTCAFEIVEQLGWQFPQHVICPVAGGTLLPRLHRGFREFREVGFVSGELPKIHAAQATGCAPVVNALQHDLEHPEPVKPNTIAQSIAIGNPADGHEVLRSVRATGGDGEMATDVDILSAIGLLARTEGILTEPAGGTALACAIQLVQRGVISRNESLVVHITGNGYKTPNALTDTAYQPTQLGRSLGEFQDFFASRAEQVPESQP